MDLTDSLAFESFVFFLLHRYFSTASSTSANRQKLANNILDLYNQFQLDGIDIDWEYPGQAGNDGNVISPNDSANYLLFLQTLRKTLPSAAKITAATMTVPFADSQGNPMREVSAFAKVLDWILIMNYDSWGCEFLFCVFLCFHLCFGFLLVFDPIAYLCIACVGFFGVGLDLAPSSTLSDMHNLHD